MNLDLLKTNVSTASLVQRTQAWSKAAGVTFRQGLKIQGGLLIKDLISLASPKSKAKGEAKIESDVRMVFAPLPSEPFGREKRGGKHGMSYLYASPGALMGVKNEDYRPKMEVPAMRGELRRIKHRGKKWINIGGRGQQVKMRVNRIVVGKGNFRKLIKAVADRVGLQKAAWAVGWRELGVSGSIPPWVSRHLTSGAARGVLVNGLSNPERPYLQIISRASGVEKKSALIKMRGAIKKRMGAMQADMKLYLAGIKKQAGFKHS